MKKVYLFGFSVLVSGFASAQLNSETNAGYQLKTNFEGTPTHGAVNMEERAGGDIIWSSDFSTPSDWITGGGGGDQTINGWSIGTTVNGWYFTSGNMGTTGEFARLRNGDADGTPGQVAGPFTFTFNGSIDLTGVPAPTLQFEQYGARFITTQEVQVSIDGGTTWVTAITNADFDPLVDGGGEEFPKPQTRSANISTLIAGGENDVMVRLFWDGAQNGPSFNLIDYGWFVDNVRVIEGYAYDIQNEEVFMRSGVGGTVSSNGLDYYMVPTSQITPITFSALVSNQGANAHAGAKLNVEVTKGSVVFTGTSSGVNLLPNAEDSFALSTDFTPTTTGTYEIMYWVDGDNAENTTNNDTMMDEFQVTDFTYARDNGVTNGTIAAVTSNPEGELMIGNVFEIFADDEIGSIQISISDEPLNGGQLIYAQIYKSNGTEYIYEAGTEDYVLQTGDLGDWVTLYLDDAFPVTDGDDLLVVAGHYGGTDPVEFNTAQNVEEGSVQGFVDGTGFFLQDPQAVMIRLDMRDFTGVEEVASTTFAVGQNVPNPFNNTSVITYSLNEEANVTVTFTDVTGKVVKTITPGAQAAGTYTLNIDGADMAEGVYFYTFTIGDNKVTKQMVVSKK